MLTEYERDAIRPHVLGKFRDLLEATAKSPAMLFYLDNWMSADPNGPHPDDLQMRPRFGQFGRGRLRPGRIDSRKARTAGERPEEHAERAQRKLRPRADGAPHARRRRRLHTEGRHRGGARVHRLDDLPAAAWAAVSCSIRAFTIAGQKVVLGHVIKAGGRQDDGEQVLDILATHPSTARFIATKLARRFVNDTPPAALVDRVAARFRETDGDLREVMRTILTSPEFLSPDAYRAKVKTPFEFVVSAVRATGADVQDAMPLVRSMQQLGMPLYMCQPPTGYKDTADAWVNTGALVNRMNFALQLAGNNLRGGGRADGRAGAGLKTRFGGRAGRPEGRPLQ